MPVELKPLPYPPFALDPVLDMETVSTHHDVHEAAYVKGVNEVESIPPQAMQPSDWWKLAFNAAGLVLHELYFEQLCSPNQAIHSKPSPEFLACVTRCFGSAPNMAHQMVWAGKNINGSGWVVLAWIPRLERMVILPVTVHQNGWIPGAVPLLVLDCWEHAYECQFDGERAPYLQAIWGVVDWGVVSRRFSAAQAR